MLNYNSKLFNKFHKLNTFNTIFFIMIDAFCKFTCQPVVVLFDLDKYFNIFLSAIASKF